MPEISDVMETLIGGGSLDRKTVSSVFRSIMDGELAPAQSAALLVALRMKKETPEEIAGAAEAMISRAATIRKKSENTVDLCGTGGDSKGTFNISTTASFIAAGAGVAVAKHGNRSVSSPVGSADVLEAAGVKIDMDLKTAERCLEETGITFLFAPLFHPSMKNVAQTRKEMGIRTVFNILGPLVNPALVKNQVIGVPFTEIMEKVVYAAKGLGLLRCMVVNGKDGMDEITVTGKTGVMELKDGMVEKYLIDPAQFGIAITHPEELRGGKDSFENAAIMRAVLENVSDRGKTDAALLNAAAAIYVSGRENSIGAALEAAKKSLESGAAVSKLEKLVEVSTNSGQA